VREKFFDLGRPHLRGMPPNVAALMKDDESFDPSDIGLFGGPSVMMKTHFFANAIRQFHGRFLKGCESGALT
jgi:hypothetical protein